MKINIEKNVRRNILRDNLGLNTFRVKCSSVLCVSGTDCVQEVVQTVFRNWYRLCSGSGTECVQEVS